MKEKERCDGYRTIPVTHHPTKTGENGQILVEFGAKNFRKSVKYVCAFKKIFPAKIGDKFVWKKFERVSVPKGEIQGCISSNMPG